MAQSTPNRVYQDFEPFFEWAEDEGSATLTVMLPGFRRDQLKVQVTSAPVLRINGEREVVQNVWRRFAKEFSIPPYCDTNEVSAKFERGMLHVKFPKLATPPNNNKLQEEEEEEEQKVMAPATPQQTQEAGNNDQQKEKEPSSDEKERSKEAASNDDLSKTASNKEQGITKEEKEPIGDEKDKSKEVVAPSEEVRSINELSKTKETTASKVNERKGAKMAQRLKTRMVDFTLSFASSDDKDNVDQQGYGGNLVTGGIKRSKTKMLMNIVVAILLVMVLGTYIKNAFRSSSPSSSQGGSEFQEF